MSYGASKQVKGTLRGMILKKLLRLGPGYSRSVGTAQVVQMASEGVEQLEIYFGKYMPQFFYSLLAPLTLFVVLSFVNLKAAAILLVCVPLIPVSIVLVQKLAKKLLSNYWGVYTDLGDSFLENLQGLTTLKIYRADGFKQEEMNRQAERFRKITMKVLTMQLNSVTLMDLIAFGGAAIGTVVALTEFSKGRIDVLGCFAILMLSAEFFIPLRLLGSFFHIAMNGMAASDKIFNLIDLPEDARGTERLPDGVNSICVKNIVFSYEENRKILKNLTFDLPKCTMTAIVGESGCGKSTFASLLTGHNRISSGSILIDGVEIEKIEEGELLRHVTLVGSSCSLLKGTVRDNLLMGKPDAGDEELWRALEQVNMKGFLQTEGGLDTPILEKASNFSGGQRQRLALARALLHDSAVYVFDEATSNVDVESEQAIMKAIHSLAKRKTVLVISHRLANVQQAGQILVFEQGELTEAGTHADLMKQGFAYANLWNRQKELESVAHRKKKEVVSV